MSKILHVAWREFLSTVATKGFIIGILITPVLIGVMVVLLPILIDQSPPKIDGELALIDPTGKVTEGVRDYLRPEEIARRRDELAEKIGEVMPAAVRQAAGDKIGSAAARQAIETAAGDVPVITVRELPVAADVEDEKAPLLEGTAQDGGRLAVAVVHENAIVRDAVGGYGNYDLFVREKLDDRIEDEIRDALSSSIIDARIAARGLDADDIRALTQVGRVRSTTVTLEGERDTNQALNMLMPMAFVLLLFISAFTSGQYLMTTTIEEKSSRVVEVLLSAVSPMQLMTGKIVGQLCVGTVILVLYAGMGIAALMSFSLLGLIDPWLFFYLLVFFVIAYFVFASLLAAIGAAVNEMREAQTLMTPLILVIMIPWMLWMPISRDPDSLFATVTSLVPPVNTFVMLLRMCSSTPPPLWQVWLSIAIGVASVFAALWFAAKVFRIGLLMHGKPPNFATLVRWVRMA